MVLDHTHEEQVNHLAILIVRRWEEGMVDHHLRMGMEVRQMDGHHLLEVCGNQSHVILLVKGIQLRRNKLSNMLG
jgi:hypothetical protein